MLPATFGDVPSGFDEDRKTAREKMRGPVQSFGIVLKPYVKHLMSSLILDGFVDQSPRYGEGLN